jgi:threonine/homoserine/homoserine lactone efflux protein
VAIPSTIVAIPATFVAVQPTFVAVQTTIVAVQPTFLAVTTTVVTVPENAPYFFEKSVLDTPKKPLFLKIIPTLRPIISSHLFFQLLKPFFLCYPTIELH